MGTAATMQIEENLALAARRGQRRTLRAGITRKERDEYRELLTYQANLAGLFGIENVRSTPQREHQQEEK